MDKLFIWRKPDEKPDFDSHEGHASIYFLMFENEHWELHYGAYYNYDFTIPATGEIQHREYIEEPYLDMEITFPWSDVKYWCYCDEFEELLKSTIK